MVGRRLPSIDIVYMGSKGVRQVLVIVPAGINTLPNLPHRSHVQFEESSTGSFIPCSPKITKTDKAMTVWVSSVRLTDKMLISQLYRLLMKV
jgi:hypothetical protein